MPWDTDQMFFRRKQDSNFTPGRQVVHSGNINTFIQPALNTKHDKLLFPFEDAFNGWRLISDDSIARRLTSGDKMQVTGVLDFVSGGSITDIKIGLNTKLTGLTNYYTKQEPDSKFANVFRIQAFRTRFFKLGRLLMQL